MGRPKYVPEAKVQRERLAVERQTIGRLIRDLRQEAAMSRRQFAEATGASLGVVEGWERGTRYVYMEEFIAVCKALRLDHVAFARAFVEAVDAARNKTSGESLKDERGISDVKR